MKMLTAFFKISGIIILFLFNSCGPSKKFTLPEKPPVSHGVVEYKIPKIKKEILKNGITIVRIEGNDLPIFAFYFGIKGGAKIDPPGLYGLGSFMMNMLLEGTKTKSSFEIAKSVEEIGGTLHADATTDYFYFSGECLPENAIELLDIFGDILLNPSFPEEEIEKKKKKYKAILKYNYSRPSYLANKLFFKKVFSNSPFEHYDTNEDVLNMINRNYLVGFYRENILEVSKNGGAYFVFYIGNTDERVYSKIYQKIKGFLLGIKGVKKQRIIKENYEFKSQNTLYIIDRKNSAQSYIMVGKDAYKISDKNFSKLYLFSEILGGNASRRLFKRLREQLGLTYGAYTFLSAKENFGYFGAYLQTATKKTARSLSELFKEMDKLAFGSVSPEELKEVKNYILGSFPIKNETPESVLYRYFITYMYNLGEGYWNKFLKEISAVTSSDIKTVANEFLPIEKKGIIIVVGDAEKIKNSIKFDGKIEIIPISEIRKY